jgi:hypothetical protein
MTGKKLCHHNVYPWITIGTLQYAIEEGFSEEPYDRKDRPSKETIDLLFVFDSTTFKIAVIYVETIVSDIVIAKGNESTFGVAVCVHHQLHLPPTLHLHRNHPIDERALKYLLRQLLD